MYDFLIVGAGFAGIVLAERIASQSEKTVLVVERRDHIGGNAYDYFDEHGILVHKYGPHIFHTNSKKVWDYLSRFTEWRRYEHKVLAVVDGMKIPVPFNLNSLALCFEDGKAEVLRSLLLSNFGMGSKVPILKLRESTAGELKKLADFIYEKVFYGYTVKQWGLKPEQLDASVTSRVPVFISHDDRYFQDTYQGLPEFGYTRMFESMLSNPLITVLLESDYRDIVNQVKFDRMIYTGPMDEFFEYVHGELPYRSLRFELRNFNMEFSQEVGTVNFPNENDFTRITEFKHLTGQNAPSTTVTYEFPETFLRKVNEPYYPVPTDSNNEMYEKYLILARKLNKTVYFIGRLADYKYYNMDQIVARALSVFEKEICDGLT